MPAQDERASKPQDDSDGRRTQEFAHGVRQFVAAVHSHDDVAVMLILALKAVTHLALGIKRLDNAQAADGLLDVAQKHAPLVLAR